MPLFFLLFWISKICFMLQTDAEKMYMVIKAASIEQNCKPSLMQHGLCGQHADSFNILPSEDGSVSGKSVVNMDMGKSTKVTYFGMN